MQFGRTLAKKKIGALTSTPAVFGRTEHAYKARLQFGRTEHAYKARLQFLGDGARLQSTPAVWEHARKARLPKNRRAYKARLQFLGERSTLTKHAYSLGERLPKNRRAYKARLRGGQ